MARPGPTRPDSARLGPTVTLFDALYLRTYFRFGFSKSHAMLAYRLKLSCQIFQLFLSNSMKMVAILVNIDFRTFFDMFSLITQKPLRFSEFS